jgi:adenosylcobinamide kinase/adenosylcobinamide-phosphate guanylyltransferase
MLHVVTGGSGSGKSAYAETELLRLAKQNNCKKYYIATMEPFGNETLKKIARHREMRKDKGFDTLERYVDLKGTAEMLTDRPAVLLECMSKIYRPDGAGEQTADSIVDGVEELCSRCEHVVIVTNEVCSECTRDSADMIRYKKILSEVNRRLAQKADWVTEVVYGIPVEVKR